MPVARPYLACAATIVIVAAGLVAGAAAPALAAFTTAQVNLITRSAGGQYQALSFSLAAGDSFNASNVSGITRVWWSHPGSSSWNLDLNAPGRVPLVRGTYERAMSGFGAEWFRPGLDLSGGTGCDGGNGRFVINQIEFAAGVVSKLDLYFEQDCGTTGTIGRLILDLPVPDAPPAGGPGVLLAASAPTDPSILRLFAQVPAGVESMVARVISLETGLEVGRTRAFGRQSDTDSLGVWSGLPLSWVGAAGFYRIDTDIIDRNGTQVSQTNVGYLAHAARAGFSTLGATPKSIDLSHRTSTVSGVLTARPAGSSQTQPIAGANLSVLTPSNICACLDHREAKVVGTGVTGPDGSFAITVSIDRTEAVFVVYQGDPATYVTGGESGPVVIQLDQTPTRLSGPAAFWGPTATISGELTYSKGLRNSDIPLANTEIELQQCNVTGGCFPAASTRTDAQGRYSLTHTRTVTDGSLMLVAKPADPFLAKATWELYYAAYDPTVIIQGLDGYWSSEHVAQFFGEITFTGSAAARRPIAVQIQTDSGWQTVLMANPVQYIEGWFFQASWVPPCGTSVWRAAYGPNNEVVSNLLRADKGCMVTMRPPAGGGGGTLPPQR